MLYPVAGTFEPPAFKGVERVVNATVAETIGREASAHFQLYSAVADGPVRWRLLSRNNRELGRGGIDFGTVEDCALAIKQLRADVHAYDVSWRRIGHQWTWALVNDGVETVVAGNRYDRRVRCEQSLQQFVVLAPCASVGLTLMVSTNRRWPVGTRTVQARAVVGLEGRPR